MIILKSSEDIKKIRFSGLIACDILDYISKYIKPGISTEKLNYLCHQRIINHHKAFPSSLGYQGFPKSVCISVNDVVCHGISSNKEILKEGDILNIDVAVIKDCYHADTSRMFFVGKIASQALNLCYITKKCLNSVLQQIKPGIKLSFIGKFIQKYIEKHGYSIVKNYCGHGIGTKLHEEPQVLHYIPSKKEKLYFKDFLLQPGMVFTVEPMVNLGKCYTKTMKDGWTVKTMDGSLSAQYEHTVCVTHNSYQVLTKR